MKKYISIDIGGTAIKYGIVDDKANILEQHTIATEARLGGMAVSNKVEAIIADYIDCFGKDSISGIAISTAGMVNTDTGEIVYASDNIPGYIGINYKERFEDLFGIVCEVENDVNCAGLAEYLMGAGMHSNVMVCLTIGTGIGGCAVINGSLLHGSHNSSCEFGYISINGQQFEKLGATSILSQKIGIIKNEPPEAWNGIHIFEGIEKEDQDCIQAVDEMCEILAEGIMNICYILDPDIVVLGGGIMVQSEYLIPRISKFIKSKMVSYLAEKINIQAAQFGNTAGMLGAYLNFINKHIS